MIKIIFFLLITFFTSFSLMGAVDTSISGDLTAKGNYYLKDVNKNFGSRAGAQIKQQTKFNSNFTLVNQLRFTYSSLYSDISNASNIEDKNTREFYLGDNYLLIKSDSWVLQTGYQDIGWGEAFGFNYADIVNPKDLRETFYTDYSDSKLPLFLVNFKYFFENGSAQLIYSPEPRFSKVLPVDLFTREILPNTLVNSSLAKSPAFLKKHEYGGKLTSSFEGIDASLFYFSYLDRDASYELRSATLTKVELSEVHPRVKTSGISLASTLYDNYVFRMDIAYTQDKPINSLQGLTFLTTPLNMTNVVFSLDTPTYNEFSGVIVLANSNLSKNLPKALRKQNQTFSIAKVAYNLGQEKTIDLSYTHEWMQNGHALQSLFLWPLSPTIEMRMGAETYWGDDVSQFSKIRNVSNVFIGFKNYFQL